MHAIHHDRNVKRWAAPRHSTRQSGGSSVLAGAVWMVVIPVGLFFLPAVNGLIGGLVGGYKIGDVKRALLASVLPAIAVSVVTWLLFAAFGVLVIGFFAGLTAGVLVLLADVGLFVGAIIGALLARGAASPHSPRR